jgi:rSAM/selenodomain-associated transferase 2
MTARVSVVVPVLDEELALPGLLDHLASLDGGPPEVIVVDGGSRDATLELARRHPLRPQVERSARGRAAQMNAGAARASGEIVAFLHADTRLPADALTRLRRAPRSVLGGNFALHFDGGDRFSRVLGRWYALQRRLGVYYGDSVIWLRRPALDALGGYRPLPIMEDYDLVRRLERSGRTACLPGPAVTSSRRWRALGPARTAFAWVFIRWLYLAGASPERLARLYPNPR